MRIRALGLLLLSWAIVPATASHAQVRERKGMTLEAAHKMVAAAEAEARRNNWTMAVAVVDEGGVLVAFHRIDDTQLGSVPVAIAKARAAVLYKRPTKALQDALPNLQGMLAVDGLLPVEGGIPVVVDGQIVGAVGASGGAPPQDSQVAAAGVKAMDAGSAATTRSR